MAQPAKITSCYGPRRLLHKFRDFHEGIDFHARQRTPVNAVADGIVVWEGPSGCAGRTLVIEHQTESGAVFAIYKHLRGYLVKAGDRVTRGQRVATSGASGVPLSADQSPRHRGCVLGAHLHFEIKKLAPGYSADRIEKIIHKTRGHMSGHVVSADPSEFWPEIKSRCRVSSI